MDTPLIKAEILIVEDSPTQLEQLRYLLEKAGYRVRTAGNGREALAEARREKPRLIVSDILMPEMDGYELCREIKGDRDLADIPVVLLTTLFDPQDVLRGLECGADNFITKPFAPSYLIARLEHILVSFELRKHTVMQTGIEVVFGKRKYFITSERQQILDLLLSTYDAAVQKNGELIAVRNELAALNEKLEQKVEERTADLRRSEGSARRLAKEKAVLAEMGRIIGSSLDIDEVYERFAAEVSRIIAFDRVAINTLDAANWTAAPTYIAGLEIPERRKGATYPLKGSATEEVLRRRSGMLVQENPQEIEHRFPPFHPVLQAGVRSVICVPLIHWDEGIGALLLMSKKEKAYTEQDLHLAESIAHQIAGAIANAQLYMELKRAEGQVRASLKEKDILLKEIHHRVRNNMQVISSQMRLQSRYFKDQEILKAFQESQTRIGSMALIHERLYRSGNFARIDMGGYIRELAASLFRTYEADPGIISLETKLEEIFLGIDTAIPCGLILNELISNSLKHAFPGGRKGKISILLHSEREEIHIHVANNGQGFPSSLDLRKTDSLGLQLVVTLVDQLDGQIELKQDRAGTEFCIHFRQGKARGYIKNGDEGRDDRVPSLARMKDEKAGSQRKEKAPDSLEKRKSDPK